MERFDWSKLIAALLIVTFLTMVVLGIVWVARNGGLVVKTGNTGAPSAVSASGGTVDFDAEFTRMMDLLQKGTSSQLTVEEITGETTEGTEDYRLVKSLYGNIKSYDITTKVDVRLRRVYVVSVDRKSGGSVTARVMLAMDAGRLIVSWDQ